MKIEIDDGGYAPTRAYTTAHNFVDLSGRKFGHLTVIERVADRVLNCGIKKPQYLCKCDCGKMAFVTGENLKRGSTKSCGCHRGDALVRYSTKHGKRYERLYSIYCDMKKRCYNKKCIGYKNYGGKGIAVCKEWLDDFNSFYSWAMENGYAEKLTIDRIDSSGNYEPSNCQWITRSENISRRNIEYWRKIHESRIR